MYRYQVILFENDKQKIVDKFIDGLSKPTFAKIIKMLEMLEQHGPYLGIPYSKKVTRQLFELRIKTSENVRLLYFPIGSKIYILHGFKKKRQKIHPKEIRTAINRMGRIST